MGEIGIARQEYLFEMRYWEMMLIYRGYALRHRDDWSMTRWQTYYIMSAQIGSEKMKKSGINNPLDLIKFPWDCVTNDSVDAPTQKEIEELRRIMQEENAKI